MRYKNCIGRSILSLVAVLMLFSASSAFAAPWYKYYLEAEDAAEKGKWSEAIKLYQKALKKESNPGTKRRAQGMLFIEYYPYLQLGKAYLETGNLSKARWYCKQADDENVAPWPEVSQCLRLARPAPTPTPTPTATPTPRSGLMEFPTPDRPTPPPPGKKMFVTHLTFLVQDSDQRYPLPFSDTKRIVLNQALGDGITLARQVNKNIVHNASGHVTPDTPQTTQTFVDIYSNPQITKEEKISRIVHHLMLPYQTDVLITGLYADLGANVTLYTFAISEDENEILSKSASFKKKELWCGSGKQLCSGASRKLAQLVKELLDQL